MNANRCFVDTNVLIYVHDRTAGPKHQRAKQIVRELWESSAGVLSTQVLQELCINTRRRIRPPATTDELLDIVQAYLGWKVVVNTGESILKALQIERRYKISFWDALIVNAAEEGGCEVLYSEDLSAGQHYGSVVVVNPFV
jgi:predicted nucleic acid-binding protein